MNTFSTEHPRTTASIFRDQRQQDFIWMSSYIGEELKPVGTNPQESTSSLKFYYYQTASMSSILYSWRYLTLNSVFTGKEQ